METQKGTVKDAPLIQGNSGTSDEGKKIPVSSRLSPSVPVFIPVSNKAIVDVSVLTPQNTPPSLSTGTMDVCQEREMLRGDDQVVVQQSVFVSVPRLGSYRNTTMNRDTRAAPTSTKDQRQQNRFKVEATPFQTSDRIRPLTPTEEDIINSLHGLGVTLELSDGSDILDLVRVHYKSSRTMAKTKGISINSINHGKLESRKPSMFPAPGFAGTRGSWGVDAVPRKQTNTEWRNERHNVAVAIRNDNRNWNHGIQYHPQGIPHQQRWIWTAPVLTPPTSPPNQDTTAIAGHAAVASTQIQRPLSSYSALMTLPPNPTVVMLTSRPPNAKGFAASLEYRAQQEMTLTLRHQLEAKDAELARVYSQIREKEIQLQHAIRVAPKHINVLNATVAGQSAELRRLYDGKEVLAPPTNTAANKFFIIFNNIASWAESYYQFTCPDLQTSAEALIEAEFGHDSRYLDFIRITEMKYLAVTRIAVEYILENIVSSHTGILKAFLDSNRQFGSLRELANAMEKGPRLSEMICGILEHHATLLSHEFVRKIRPLRSRTFDPAHEKNSSSAFLFICQEAARVCHLLLKQKLLYETSFPCGVDVFYTDFMKAANPDNVGLNVSEPVRDVALVEMQGSRVLLCMLPGVWAAPMDGSEDWKLWCKASVYVPYQDLSVDAVDPENWPN